MLGTGREYAGKNGVGGGMSRKDVKRKYKGYYLHFPCLGRGRSLPDWGPAPRLLASSLGKKSLVTEKRFVLSLLWIGLII